MGRKRNQTQAQPPAAIPGTIVAIEQDAGITVEQHLKNLGLLESAGTPGELANPSLGEIEPGDGEIGQTVMGDQTIETAPAVELVKMVRSPFDSEDMPAPFEADVHPDEVANYAAHGWKVAE